MDERIRTLFASRMELILDQRKNEAHEEAGRLRSQYAARGTLHSSMCERSVARAYEEKYDELCKEAWSQLHRIAVTVGVQPNESLIRELRGAFDNVMIPLAAEYLGKVRQNNTFGRGLVSDAEASFLTSRDIVGNEIELFSTNTAMQVSLGSGSTYVQNYTFAGPIGAFQQGDHSAATVTQNIDTSGLEAFRSTLDSLLEKFGDHDQLGPLLAESKAEANKPQPQWGHLRGLLTGIKAFISLVKDGKELFDEAERAARSCGMDELPSILP